MSAVKRYEREVNTGRCRNTGRGLRWRRHTGNGTTFGTTWRCSQSTRQFCHRTCIAV